MQKLVVFKLDGDLDKGVRVTLEIGEERVRPTTEIQGDLPPQPELIAQYKDWQSTYRSLGTSLRIRPIKVSLGGSLTEPHENCKKLGDCLSHQLNSWLNAVSFSRIKETLLKHLAPDDTVRVLIKTDNIWLRRLPWQSWKVLDEYSQAEVALSTPEYSQFGRSKTGSKRKRINKKIQILAILGNSDGIDIDIDRKILNQLPDAETTFLVKPTRHTLNEQVWAQRWDILFFAGHSSSQDDGETGRIYINQTDSLTIYELKYALREAVESGLQLAIFNSCDGLGLAHQLENLHIPQILVMREPVPDKVAQEFLTDFLTQFSGGKSLYLAVRKAREKLQGLEDKFPCASWLPVICQNPAVVPPTWEDLLKKPELELELKSELELELKPELELELKSDNPSSEHRQTRPIPRWRSWQIVVLTSMVVTSLVMGVRYLGMLQAWELQAYDQLMRSRPTEGSDSRLLVVTITEEDFQHPEQKNRKGSLSDRALNLLLQKLESYQPRAIGLDIYRDFPVDSNEADLATRMRHRNNFFAICKGRDTEANHPGTAPPPDVPTERQGFSDVLKDPDGVLRRHLLAINPSPTSPCTTPYALSAQLAFHYLEAEGISAKYTEKGDLQLGKVTFKRLRNHRGGYQNVDAWGNQILLNYRSYRSPLKIAPTVTLTEVLSNSVKPDQVKGRIVLIGITAQSAQDYIPTPYSIGQGFYEEMPGVIVQTQMVSQLLSAVKDKRPLLGVWPVWGEALWIGSWSFVGSFLVCRCRSRLYLALVVGSTLGVLYVLCFALFTQGYWVPLVPSVLALVVTSSSVLVYPASKATTPVVPIYKVESQLR